MQNGKQTLIGLGLLGVLLAGACKSEEEKRAEAVVEAQKKAAESAIAAAEAQAKVAEQQLEKSAEALAKQGEVLGQQGAALGMQAAAAGLQAAAAAMNDVAGAAGGGGKGVQLVDFRALKGLLPEKIAGLARKRTSGEKNAALGFGVSEAKGIYEGEGGARIEIKMIDHGGLAGMAAAAFAFDSFEVDKESDDGYERTITVDGRKIYEKYSNPGKKGELKVMVAKRFLVEVEGDDVPMTTMKEALAKLDLAKLEALAPVASK